MVSKSLLLPTVPISAHHKLGTSTHSQPPNSSTTLYTNGTASAPSQSPPPASPSSATSPPPSPPEPTPPHPQPTPPYRSHQNLRRRLPRHRREVHSLHWRARRTILPRNRRPPLRRRSHLVLRLLPHSRRPPCRPSPSLMGRVVRECRSESLRCYVCERAIRHRNQYSLPHRPNQRLARLPYRVLCGRHVQRTRKYHLRGECFRRWIRHAAGELGSGKYSAVAGEWVFECLSAVECDGCFTGRDDVSIQVSEKGGRGRGRVGE